MSDSVNTSILWMGMISIITCLTKLDYENGPWTLSDGSSRFILVCGVIWTAEVVRWEIRKHVGLKEKTLTSYIWGAHYTSVHQFFIYSPLPANCPDVPCTHVSAEIFTPGLLLLGATQSPPQMCPVNLDKEEHGQLITMLLSYKMALLRVLSFFFFFFKKRF